MGDFLSKNSINKLNKSELSEFLSKFSIEKEIIDKFLLGKEIVEINSNLFLTQKKPSKDLVYEDILLFIDLRRFLPSKFLLDFISKNSKTLSVKTDKSALNFTYFKDLLVNEVIEKNLESNKYYIITYSNEILGFCEFKGNKLLNLMNIGQYLQEN